MNMHHWILLLTTPFWAGFPSTRTPKFLADKGDAACIYMLHVGHHLEQTTHSKPTCEGDAAEAAGDFVHPRLQSRWVRGRISIQTDMEGITGKRYFPQPEGAKRDPQRCSCWLGPWRRNRGLTDIARGGHIPDTAKNRYKGLPDLSKTWVFITIKWR